MRRHKDEPNPDGSPEEKGNVMTIGIYTPFIFEHDEDFTYRVNILHRTAAPSVAMQTDRDYVWHILVKEKHAGKLLSTYAYFPGKLSLIPVPDDLRYQKYPEKPGYEVWGYFDLSYDIQVRFDSDDILHPSFLRIVRQIESQTTGTDTLVSFQYKKLLLETGRYYRQGRKWKDRCSSLAVVIRPRNMTVYSNAHSRLHKHAKYFYFVSDDSYYTVTIHDRHVPKKGMNGKLHPKPERIEKNDKKIFKNIDFEKVV